MVERCLLKRGAIQEPIVPSLLEKAQKDGETYRLAEEAHKSSDELMQRFKDTPDDKVKIVSKPGRPTMKFVDVGGKFINVDERLRRIAESERRARIKARRGGKRVASSN